MPTPTRIENDFLRVTVWPEFGGKVSSIIDKTDGFELLFQYAAKPPEPPVYDLPFAASWYAGWDECFPGVAAGPYPQKPWEGIVVPDHGELWGLPTQLTTEKSGITTTWHGVRFPYRLTRTILLDGPAVDIRYRLENLSPFLFRFVWAMHALAALDEPTRIDLPPGTPMRLSHDATGNTIDASFAWPMGPGGEDFSRLDTLPPGRGWKLFSQQRATGPASIHYPTRRRRLEIGFSSADAAAYWGLWLNTGGWAGHRHFALEPTTGRHDALDRSVADGSAATLAPGGTVEWSVTWRVGESGP
jgi:hypothetical protein